jgi:ATP-dependent RNA helicase DOB1
MAADGGQYALGRDQSAYEQGSGANIVEQDGKACTHEVAWPAGMPAGEMKPPARRAGAAAREYPFHLDPFQQVAINALEAGGFEHAALL